MRNFEEATKFVNADHCNPETWGIFADWLEEKGGFELTVAWLRSGKYPLSNTHNYFMLIPESEEPVNKQPQPWDVDIKLILNFGDTRGENMYNHSSKGIEEFCTRMEVALRTT